MESLQQSRSRVLPAVQMFDIRKTAGRSRHSVTAVVPASIATDHMVSILISPRNLLTQVMLLRVIAAEWCVFRSTDKNLAEQFDR